MQGWCSGVWGVSSLGGPWLGGVLSDHASWRWVFYVNLPFGAVAMALIATGLLEEARSPRRPVMDLGGVALFAAGVSAVLLGVVEAGRAGAWSGSAVLAPPGVGGAAPVLFVGVGQRGAQAHVPPPLLRRPGGGAAGVT